MPYLKQSLPENENVTLVMKSRLGQDNSGQYGPKFKYQFSWDGSIFDHDASMNEEKVLQKAMPGDTLEAKKVANPHGKGYMIYWERKTGAAVPKPFAQAPVAPDPVANPKPPAQPEWDKIALSKIVHNFMIEGYKLGKSPTEAGADAKEFASMQETIVEQMWSLKAVDESFAKEPQHEYND